MTAAILGTFVRISGLTFVAGIMLGLLIVSLEYQPGDASTIKLLTLTGVCMFVGFLAVFLLYTSRWPDR